MHPQLIMRRKMIVINKYICENLNILVLIDKNLNDIPVNNFKKFDMFDISPPTNGSTCVLHLYHHITLTLPLRDKVKSGQSCHS